MESARDRLASVLERIDKAAHRSGRKPDVVTLVAVTKTISLDCVQPFLDAGIKNIGENRVQEALMKYSMPSPFSGEGPGEGSVRPVFHLIGPLQTNKAKKAVGFFDMIQSLDRLDLAQELNRHAEAIGKIQDCLVEVKISEEASKSGLDPVDLSHFLSMVRSFPHLRVRGLMGIPPLSAQGQAARPYFKRLRGHFEETQLEILSMGMSSDFEIAIEEGATMVRLGSILFGPRSL
jgi:pyridoxal phosphate enzyme (YggS family)